MFKVGCFILMMLLLSACADNSDKGFVDEVHRPKDWHEKVQLKLLKTADEDGMVTHYFNDLSENAQYENLVDQLFDFAFTGDAKVLEAGILGNVSEQELDPKELHEKLKKMDTVSITDLKTGFFKDTVIDLSFRKQNVSAVQINGKLISEKDQWQFLPVNVAIGEQVFDDFADFRGYKTAFYIGLSSAKDYADYDFSFNILSDSLGVFHLSSMSDFVINRNVFQEIENVEFELGFDFKNQAILVSPIKETKLDEKAL